MENSNTGLEYPEELIKDLSSSIAAHVLKYLKGVTELIVVEISKNYNIPQENIKDLVKEKLGLVIASKISTTRASKKTKEVTETPSGEGCTAIIKTGPNAGYPCGSKPKANGLCGRHSQKKGKEGISLDIAGILNEISSKKNKEKSILTDIKDKGKYTKYVNEDEVIYAHNETGFILKPSQNNEELTVIAFSKNYKPGDDLEPVELTPEQKQFCKEVMNWEV